MSEHDTICPQEKLRQFEPEESWHCDCGAVLETPDDQLCSTCLKERACTRSEDGWHHFRFVDSSDAGDSLYRCSECGKESLV